MNGSKLPHASEPASTIRHALRHTDRSAPSVSRVPCTRFGHSAQSLQVAMAAIPNRQHKPVADFPRPAFQGHPFGLTGHVLPGHAWSGTKTTEMRGAHGDDGHGHEERAGFGAAEGDGEILHGQTIAVQ